MSDYTFSTLNDKEFEQLARDLLNAQLNLSLQNFKSGKDGGIDLRLSSLDNTNTVVVQAKHYYKSGYSQLKAQIKSKELEKVKLLKPDRYILVTSVPLSPQYKNELWEILSPHILTPNDIFGNEDLNALLQKFGKIEKQHFKLWFSSVNVLNTVINNAIEGRTKYLLERIKAKVPYYVITSKLGDAIMKLETEKILLITGQPGIGKTTLAEIILFERSRNGYEIYKVEDIKEAETVISPDDDTKQVFYFDDFLGSNYSEIVNTNKTESLITSFVDRIKNTPNKYLILTTRTVILTYAKETSERINRSRISHQQFELVLSDYSQFEKAQILYNHLYFNNVDEKLYEAIVEKKFYNTIIQHKNYTPRIIEFITDSARIKNFNSDEFLQFILTNLNNPKEIWRYSFINQIQYVDRCFLLTLFTFEHECRENHLIKSFHSRLQYEKEEHNQVISSDQFDKSVNVLLGGFISSKLHDLTNGEFRQYGFINPSLTDFLIAYVNESSVERKAIISSIKYVEQLSRFNPNISLIPLEKELQSIIKGKIENSGLLLLDSNEQNSNNKKIITFVEILCTYCNEVDVDELILNNIKQLDYEKSWFTIMDQLSYVIFKLSELPLTRGYIIENFTAIIEKFIDSVSTEDEALLIPLLFSEYGFEYGVYSESEDGSQIILDIFNYVISLRIEELQDQHNDKVQSLDEVDDLYYEIRELEDLLFSKLFPETELVDFSPVEIDKQYWENAISENMWRAKGYTPEHYDKDYYHHNAGSYQSDNDLIDELFYRD